MRYLVLLSILGTIGCVTSKEVHHRYGGRDPEFHFGQHLCVTSGFYRRNLVTVKAYAVAKNGQASYLVRTLDAKIVQVYPNELEDCQTYIERDED